MNENSRLRKIERIFSEVNGTFFNGSVTKPKFKLNSRMRKAGRVNLGTMEVEISISYHDTYGWDSELTNTVKHEMIHLYMKEAGKPAGHNRSFKEVMARIGCTLHSRPNKRPYKYVFECPRCGKEYKTRKWIGARYSCGPCSVGRFNREYILKLKERLDSRS
jgi:SprT-like protein